MSTDLPDHIRDRADLEALLARATNWEERRPRKPTPEAFRLERVRDLLASVGNPQEGPRTVHIAGSKGKGSVARMVDAVLRRTAAGPVGRFTSPHLEDLTERVAIDGRPVEDAELAGASDALLPYVRRTLDTPSGATFFELLTAAAWLVFRGRGCSDVVLETGLGGRLDATNVCRPALTLITTIEREHVEFLGDTIPLIAAEKAGILKEGVPAATSVTGEALDVVRQRAADLRIPLAIVGRDVVVESVATREGPVTEVELAFAEGTTPLRLRLPLAGRHHGTNAALSAWAARQLGASDDAIRSALAEVTLPGVLEPLGGEPLVIADGAHTPNSAKATREAVERCWPGRRRVLLIALLGGKDPTRIAQALSPGAAGVVVTRLPSPRTLEPREVADAFERQGVARVVVREDVAAALGEARSMAGEDGLVLATGSVRIAGLVRRLARQPID